MEFKDLIELLYTARNRFTSIQMTWNYWYHIDIMQKAHDKWAAQSPGSPVFLRSKSGRKNRPQKEITIKRQIWWQKPACWRFEESVEGKRNVIEICSRDDWWVFNPTNKKLYTNFKPEGVQTKFRRRDSKDAPKPTLAKFMNDVPFVDPSFLLASHDLSIEGDMIFAKQEAIWVRGTPRRGRVIPWDSFFWAGADSYEFLVDKKWGVLLRYAAKLEEQEFAVASVTNIAVDELIPDDLFFFDAPANASVELFASR